MNKIKAFCVTVRESVKAIWETLPQPIKTTIVIFEGGVTGALLQLVADPGAQVCFSKACFKHYAGAIMAGGVTAVRLYYRASPNQVPQPVQAVTKEKK